MNSDELLDQAPTISQETENAVQSFFNNPPAKKSETPETQKAGELPIKEPNPLPPEPEVGSAKQLAQGTIQSVDEAQFQKDLDEAQAQLDLLKMAPEERYKAILKREGIDLEEARKIIDSVVIQLRPWTERVWLTKKHSAVFKTRTQEDQERFNRVLETEMPQYDATVRTHIVTYNLAASIVRYGDRDFPRETDDDFKDILKWISELPSPTYVLLSRKLSEFDRKIDLVFQEGYLENF